MNFALPTLKISFLLGVALFMAGCNLELTQAEETPAPEKTASTDAVAADTNEVAVTENTTTAPVVERKLSAQLQELLKMAERGLGATVLPRSVLRDEPNAGVVELTRISKQGLHRKVIVSWLAARHLSVPVNTVLMTIRAIAELLTTRGIFVLAERNRAS